jgi:hypothetical protein
LKGEKMKNARLIILTAILLAMQAMTVSTVCGNTVTIPLTVDYWDLFGYPTGASPTMTQASDGIQFFGSGYRWDSALSSKAQWDLTHATVYLKWQANGAGLFMAVSPSFWLQNEFDLNTYYGGSFSTGNQYGSTTLISENTWYYSRITFDPVNGVTGVTATQNYDDQGGAIVQRYLCYAPSSQNDLANLQHVHVGLELADMYGGARSWAKIGEIQIVNTPEPAMLFLLTLGSLFLRRR